MVFRRFGLVHAASLCLRCPSLLCARLTSVHPERYKYLRVSSTLIAILCLPLRYDIQSTPMPFECRFPCISPCSRLNNDFSVLRRSSCGTPTTNDVSHVSFHIGAECHMESLWRASTLSGSKRSLNLPRAEGQLRGGHELGALELLRLLGLTPRPKVGKAGKGCFPGTPPLLRL